MKTRAQRRCVFYSAASARAARDRFFPGDAGIRLIGLGLPDAFAGCGDHAATSPA